MPEAGQQRPDDGNGTNGVYPEFGYKISFSRKLEAAASEVTMSERIKGFEELQVYQEACALDYAVFLETKKFPREEMYSLTDQIRRSSRSIGGNIAESWAKRRYPAHFVSKLTDADGELQETQHWLGRAKTYGYLPDARHAELLAQCKSIGRKLGRMIQIPDSFSK